MAITVTATVNNDNKGLDNSQRRNVEQGTFTLAGTYVTGGFAFPFKGLLDVSGAAVLLPTLEQYPVWVEVVQAIPGDDGLLYFIVWNYSTHLFQIFVSGTATDGLDELAETTPPAGTFAFRAEFLNQA